MVSKRNISISGVVEVCIFKIGVWLEYDVLEATCYIPSYFIVLFANHT